MENNLNYVANPVLVFARAITDVHLNGKTYDLTLSDGHIVKATAAQTARHTPVPGDYWVVQADGYEYINPRDVFERKYRPIDDIPDHATEQMINESIVDIAYDVLKDGRTTVCTLTLKNGFTVRGESLVVNSARFDKALGEKYAFEQALDRCWPFFGFLVAQKRHEAGIK